MATYNLPPLRDAMSRALAARQAPPDGGALIRSRLKGPPDDMNSPEAEPWKKALNPEPEFDHTLYRQPRAEPPSPPPPLPAPITSSADSQNLPQPDSPVPTENGTRKTEHDQPSLEQRSLDQLQRNTGRLRFKEALLQDQKQFLADAHKNYTISLNRLKKRCHHPRGLRRALGSPLQQARHRQPPGRYRLEPLRAQRSPCEAR